MLRWTVHVEGAPRKGYLAAVAVGGATVYSFGGYCDQDQTYDFRSPIKVHVFNMVSLSWMKLSPQNAGRGDDDGLQVPSGRACHTAVLIDDMIYIWGGLTDPREESRVLYAFDVDAHRWSKPGVSGTVPEAREDHSACVLGKVMYVFGGFNELTGCTNDIYKLDTSAAMVWSLINVRGMPAPVSQRHSATVIGTKMFVFGGLAPPDNNVRVFDTETDRWLSTASSAQLLPERCKGHSAFAYNGELYIFGGDNLNWRFNDFWKYNPEKAWTKVEPKGMVPCRKTSLCCCMVGDHIILFGGNGYTSDDLYILDLSPSLKTLCKLAVLQHGLEQSDLPHDIRWELEAMTTNKQQARRIRAH